MICRLYKLGSCRCQLPGIGDPPEVPEEPDDLDASAEARSSDHVGL